MEAISVCNCSKFGRSPRSFSNTVEKKDGRSCPTTTCYLSSCKFKQSISSVASSFSSSSYSCSSSSLHPRLRVRCSYDSGNNGDSEDESLTSSWAYDVLGLDPRCSSAQLKAAFRIKVKQFHPDVMRDGQTSDIMIRRVIQAYEILSSLSKSEIIERECMDPFGQPECEALDLFINEVLCIGRGCPFSCVNKAPHVFKFSSVTGTAHATCQGRAEDYEVQLAVGQCPRSCIHYVTPSQRIILEDLLCSMLNMPYDTSAEAEVLYALIVKAQYENNRYHNPNKKNAKHVRWF